MSGATCFGAHPQKELVITGDYQLIKAWIDRLKWPFILLNYFPYCKNFLQ